MIKIGEYIKFKDFPILLAPMEDVSDPPFRALCKEEGADIVYTEFISCEGIIRNATKSIQKLDIYDAERPVGIQIFGADINSMLKALDVVEQSKPDIIDINFGCPVKKVVNKGAGAAILKDIPKMEQLTKTIVKRTKLPVTVKTRLGWDYDSIKIIEVAERLQDAGIKALTIHGRTRKQMYKGPARWEPIAEVKNNPRINIPIFGNGDVNSPEKALEMKNKYALDGAMIGRASIGNPWFFNEIKYFFKYKKHKPPISIEKKVSIAKKHLEMSIRWKGEKLGILETRKHYNNYFKGIPNFKSYKIKLVTSNNFDEIFETFENILNKFC